MAFGRVCCSILRLCMWRFFSVLSLPLLLVCFVIVVVSLFKRFFFFVSTASYNYIGSSLNQGPF